MLPLSKLQQAGALEGIALITSVGVEVGATTAIQVPSHPDSPSQFTLLRLQYSPPPQDMPPSKLQQAGAAVGVMLGVDEGVKIGVEEGASVGLKVLDGKSVGGGDGATDGS